MFGTYQGLTGLQFGASASFAVQIQADMIPFVTIQAKSYPPKERRSILTWN